MELWINFDLFWAKNKGGNGLRFILVKNKGGMDSDLFWVKNKGGNGLRFIFGRKIKAEMDSDLFW